MGKKARIYVEGKSDELLLYGSQFNAFFIQNGYSVTIKNLKCKGNVITNFKKHINLQPNDIKIAILLYDRDKRSSLKLKEENIKVRNNNTPHIFHEAIQEIEAWYWADTVEIKKISSDQKIIPNSESIVKPKERLIELFFRTQKGFKTEVGLAEHFKDRINLHSARKNNKSLHRFLEIFEKKIKVRN